MGDKKAVDTTESDNTTELEAKEEKQSETDATKDVKTLDEVMVFVKNPKENKVNFLDKIRAENNRAPADTSSEESESEDLEEKARKKAAMTNEERETDNFMTSMFSNFNRRS